jgi:hypothetical protein
VSADGDRPVRLLGALALAAAVLGVGARLRRTLTGAGADPGVTLLTLLGLLCGLAAAWLRDGEGYGRLGTAGWVGGTVGLVFATVGYAALFAAEGSDDPVTVVAGGVAAVGVLVGLLVAGAALPVFGAALSARADRRALRAVGWSLLAAPFAAAALAAVAPPPLAVAPYLLAVAGLGADLASRPSA